MTDGSDQDPSQKTEDATPRRKEKSREEGQVARSREVNNWLVLALATVMLGTVFFFIGGYLKDALSGIVYRAPSLVLSPRSVLTLVDELGFVILLTVLLPCFLIALVGMSGGLIQHGLLFSNKPLVPKLERINPQKGLKRVFSQQSLVEFLKGILKITVVGAAGFLAILPEYLRIDTLPRISVTDIVPLFQRIALKLMLAMLAVYFLIMIGDTVYQFFAHAKRIRMTRQEVKDEFKQTEGYPHVKAHIRQIRMERHRRRLTEAMERADVVVTNPTHFAVALAYSPEEMDAPEVVAKGADHMALLIRRLAEERDVSVVEDPPLARALYESAEEGRSISPKHYRAVAAIISKVFSLKGKKLN